MDLFLFSGDGGNTRTLLFPLESDNLNHFTGPVIEVLFSKKSKAIPVTGLGGL
jgi:hypothetical protein